VEKNQRVALIGKIGSGKSTLLSLIPRLYVPEPGQLFLLGKDSHHWDLQELRKNIGYVSQEIFLMSDTIESNVSLGIQENSLDEEKTTQVIHSLQSAQLLDEIQSLPEALRTLLGERGLNLSGGQRQRLTIARALSRKPQLLILDDALSSVDVKTEQLINQRLHDQKMTQLLAAHRISTIKESDWIVVLDSGTVSEQGTHVQLLKQQGLYYQFYEQQKYQEEVNAELENYIKQKDLT
jgi:ATP-binding cassette subfamily B protein